MSLINDALKRARQAQPKPSPSPVPGAPLRPVETARPRGAPPGLVWLVAGALVLGLVAIVLILTAIRGGAANDRELASTPTKPAVKVTAATNVPPPASKPAPVVTTLVVQPKPVPPAAPAPVVVPGVASPAIPETNSPTPAIASPVVAPAVATNAPTVVAAAPPQLPKLQGIFYRPDRPSALLNGKTVLIGERSGESLVVAISRQSVTLVRAGVTNVLRMGE